MDATAVLDLSHGEWWLSARVECKANARETSAYVVLRCLSELKKRNVIVVWEPVNGLEIIKENANE